MTCCEAIVVGVSTGGLEALSAIVPRLPEDFGSSMIVVQHRLEDVDGFLARHLDGLSRVRVIEANDKQAVERGAVYIAPAGYHLYVSEDRRFNLSVDERVCYARPSVDVLFMSAADVYGDELIGVVLTGANKDGAEGLKYIKEKGGLAVVQSPESAVAVAMPEAAMRAVTVDRVLDLDEIGPFLAGLARRMVPTR